MVLAVPQGQSFRDRCLFDGEGVKRDGSNWTEAVADHPDAKLRAKRSHTRAFFAFWARLDWASAPRSVGVCHAAYVANFARAASRICAGGGRPPCVSVTQESQCSMDERSGGYCWSSLMRSAAMDWVLHRSQSSTKRVRSLPTRRLLFARSP